MIDIEAHIERSFPDPPLMVLDDHGALKAGEKVLQKFSAWIRNRDAAADNRLKVNLTEELQRLNMFLGSNQKLPGKYLAGDEMLMPDCVLLPKLHQLRIALRFFKEYEVPEDLYNLQSYLRAADNNEVFAKTCCEDIEILEGWSKHFGDARKAQQILRAASRK